MEDTSRQYSVGIADKTPLHSGLIVPFSEEGKILRAELLRHYTQISRVHLKATNSMDAPCAKRCSNLINASSSCFKMLERW